MDSKTADHVGDMIKSVKDAVNNGDPIVLGILTAVVIVLLTIVFFVISKQRGNKRRGVLLLGCCDAGKTLLFTQLVNKKYRQSFTSMSANTGTYTVESKNKSLRMIDLPGHERVRMQILDSYKEVTRAVMFVVDSSSVQKDIKDIAEFLYTVLCDSKISSIAPPVLIVCNKQDLTFSKGIKVIKSQLEKEMNTVRVTKSAALQDISSGNNNTYLGKRNREFSFSDLKPISVEFAECSAQGKNPASEPDLKEVEEWLAKVA